MFPVTKFRPPVSAAHAVARPAVFERASRERPSALVVRAPAGYGKTTAVAQWLSDSGQGDGPRGIWVSLDQDDDDPEGLWLAVTAGATAAGLHQPHRSGAAPAGGVRAGLIVPLIDAFAASPAPWTLVLDDAHLLDRESTLASLDWFLGHAPDNVMTVIITRTALELPTFERLQARGRGMELGIDELRLDARQTAELLDTSYGLRLDARELAHLEDLTDGWPAAVSLVASALSRGVVLPRATAGRAEGGGLDALVREGLAGSSPEDHSLLQMLSIFERFDAATVDAVLGDARAWPLAMEVAERTGLIVGLDGEGRWWRMHQLVRDRLTAELERGNPERRRALHRLAFAALEPEHDLALSIHHLIGAEDYDTVADILSNVRANAVVPRQSLGLSWLDRIPESALNRDPRLAFWEAWATATGGDPARRDRALARGRRAAGERAVEGFDSWDDVEDFVHSMACYNDVGAATRAGERFLAGHDPSNPLSPLVALRLATMRYLAGRCAEALELLDALDRGAPLPRPLRVLVPAYRALCDFELGDRAAATMQIDRMQRARIAFEVGADPVYLSAEQAIARQHTETGAPDAARATVMHALGVARQQPSDTVLAVPYLLIELGRAEAALGRRSEALIALTQAEELCDGAVDVGALLTRISALRASLHGARSRRPVRGHLSRRELEVLELLPTSLSAAEIGSELFISANTARSHIKSIYQKLGATTRAEAVAAGRRAELIGDLVRDPNSRS